MILKNLILYVGTPRIFIEIIDYLKNTGVGSACLFSKEDNDEWMIQETLNLELRKFKYGIEELSSELNEYSQIKPNEKVIIFHDGSISQEDRELIAKVLNIHYMYIKDEIKDETISRLTYSMTGIETFIGSLLEPMEPSELLSILSDAFGEILLSSSTLFKRSGEYFRNVNNHGFDFIMPDIKTTNLNSTSLYFSFPVNLKDHAILPELKPEVDKLNACYGIPVIIEDKVEYIVLVGRSTPINSEEQTIINSLCRILSRIVEYHSLKAAADDEKKKIEKSNFRLLSFYKGLEFLFSRASTLEFSLALSDMVKEIFQLENIRIFVRKNWGNLLWDTDYEGESKALISKYSSVWDVYDLRKENELEAFKEDFGNSAMYLRDYPIGEYQKGVFASVIRSMDGYILGVMILYGFDESEKEFLSMICSMSGLALNSMLMNNDFSKIVRSYEEIMIAFQNAHSLYKELQLSSGIVDFYNRLKKILSKDFQINEVYLAFDSKDKIISFPNNPDKDIMNTIEKYLDYSESDLIAISNPFSEKILYVQPLNLKYKKIVVIFEAKDDAKINIILQLIQLGFKDTLARILAEERY